MARSRSETVAGLMMAFLPAGLQRVLALVGRAARRTGARPYLVGGTVRDLLLGRANTDLDLVVEGDALELAAEVGRAIDTPVTRHPEFGTATLWLPWPTWQVAGDPAARLPAGTDGLHMDLAATRTETYPRRAALPVVALGADLATDLRRRDFTTNAIAVALRAGEAGRLIDPYAGVTDLAAGRLRVLHAASFADDPTRLLRGIRLAGRLWCRFAVETEALVQEAVAHHWLGLVSAERRWHELTLLLAEERPAAALALARAHGLLAEIHPALRWDGWLADRLARAVDWAASLPLAQVRLTLMAFRWPRETIEGFVGLLHPDGATREAVEALPRWRDRRAALTRATTGAAVAAALEGLPLATLAAARLAEDEPSVARQVDWYVTDLARRRPRLGGEALRQLGLTPGPAFRPLLAALRRAVLDGELADEAAEWRFLRRLVDETPAPGPTNKGGSPCAC